MPQDEQKQEIKATINQFVYSELEIRGLIKRFENHYHQHFKLDLNNSDRTLFVGEFIENNLTK